MMKAIQKAFALYFKCHALGFASKYTKNRKVESITRQDNI